MKKRNVLRNTVIATIIALSNATQDAHAQTGNSVNDIYKNDATGLCMNVAGPGSSSYLNRKISQYECSRYFDREQIFISDPQQDRSRLLRFGGNDNLCWNTVDGTTNNPIPFLFNCMNGDQGQMMTYQRSLRRLIMDKTNFCIEADAGGNYAPIRLKPCSSSRNQQWTILKW